MFLPEPRQSFIAVAESHLQYESIGLEGSLVQSWAYKKERTQRRARIQLRLQTTEATRNSAKPGDGEPALVLGCG